MTSDQNFTSFKTININTVTTTGATSSTGLINTGWSNFGQGTVTQGTSNATTVVCNSSSGLITMHAVLNAVTSATFTGTKSLVTANSVVLVSIGKLVLVSMHQRWVIKRVKCCGDFFL